MASLERALAALGIAAPLYISQNDGTLISAAEAARYQVLTIGSGPTNSMRGSAFLTGVYDGIVMVVGGTTCDLGRSEARRVGKECVHTCTSRRRPFLI